MSFLLCSPRFSSSMLGPNIHLLSSHYWHINQLFSSYSLGFPLFINYPWLYLPFSQTLHLLACPHLPVLGCSLSHCSHREGTHIILFLLSIATFRQLPLLLYINILPLRVASSAITPTLSLVIFTVDFLGATHIYYRTEHLDHTYHLPLFSSAVTILGPRCI